ncbi:MAG: tetratricopeptide repeat protein [Rhodospirillales bacterium]|nr:tetratricopeptide repeat protein [Rhodospirillales bacterium]
MPLADHPLKGETLFLVGRIQGLTRRRLDMLVRLREGKLATRPGRNVTLIAFGHSAGNRALDDGRVALPTGLPGAAPLVSENVLRRQLGLLAPPEEVDRSMGRAEIERLAGLTPNLVSCLVLFDVLEPVDERFAWRDLVAAREAARLLKRGVAIGDVLEAAMALSRRGGNLAEARLTEGPSGELLREMGGQLAELSGQLTMPLTFGFARPGQQKPRSIDDLLFEAEEAELAGDHAAAESLYTTAMRADTADPVLPFNLGNVFQAEGRAAEAKVAWQIAVARDPAFAEAWYNLALAAEDEQQTDLAIAEYRRAVKAQPDWGDAHFNLALLLTKADRCVEALAAWERFLEVEPSGRHAATAQKAIALCRMKIQQERAQTG